MKKRKRKTTPHAHALRPINYGRATLCNDVKHLPVTLHPGAVVPLAHMLKILYEKDEIFGTDIVSQVQAYHMFPSTSPMRDIQDTITYETAPCLVIGLDKDFPQPSIQMMKHMTTCAVGRNTPGIIVSDLDISFRAEIIYTPATQSEQPVWSIICDKKYILQNKQKDPSDVDISFIDGIIETQLKDKK